MLLKKGLSLGMPCSAIALGVDVDAEHLAKERVHLAAVLEHVVGATAVAHGNVEVAIMAEGKGATVVVPHGLLDGEEHFFFGSGVSPVRIVLADFDGI